MKIKTFNRVNRISKLFLWLGGILLSLFILNLIFNDSNHPSKIFLSLLIILCFIQYFLAKLWYIKIEEDSILIRSESGIRIEEFFTQRFLVTKY